RRLESEHPELLLPGMVEYIDASRGLPGLLARSVAQLTEEDPHRRRLAATELCERATELRNADLTEARRKLMELVKNDNDIEVRVAAVDALGALGPGDGAVAVEFSETFARLLESNQLWWREGVAAVSALGELPLLAPRFYSQLKMATR